VSLYMYMYNTAIPNGCVVAIMSQLQVRTHGRSRTPDSVNTKASAEIAES
jgi:hypothetical protein